MGTNSKIPWTDNTWNPWRGCSKVSAGCDNCYMERGMKRFGQDSTKIHMASSVTFFAPVAKTRLKQWKWPDGSFVFTCSWSDFFHPGVDPIYRQRCWEMIAKRPGLTFQILTKRPELVVDCLPPDWGDGYSNVWIGVTAENYKMADKRVPILAQIPAVKRFVSIEPMLSPVFYNGVPDCVDWVIVGGETGPGARRIHPEWVRALRDRCFAACVPLFVKQVIPGKPIPDDLALQQYPGEIDNHELMGNTDLTKRKRELQRSNMLLHDLDIKRNVNTLAENKIRDVAFASLYSIVREYRVNTYDAISMRRFARERVVISWGKDTPDET